MVGGIVVAGFVLILVFSYGGGKVDSSGYLLKATFNMVDGLAEGGDVRLSGIKVGNVVDHALDPETFDAVVKMTIASDVKLPLDTEASIASGGLLGGKYVRLKPGVEKSYLAAGGRITKTNDFRSLEDQVGEIIFLATGGSDSGEDGGNQ